MERRRFLGTCVAMSGTPCFLLNLGRPVAAAAALGTVGAEQFDAFFAKCEFKLALDHGQGKARRPVGASAAVRELAQYCKQTIQC